MHCNRATCPDGFSSDSRSAKRIALACGGTVAFVGLFCLGTWMAPLVAPGALAGFEPIGLLPGTCLALSILGMCMAIGGWEGCPAWVRWTAAGATAGVALDGLLELVEPLAGVELGISETLLRYLPVRVPLAGASPPVGLMICLVGSAILLQLGRRRQGRYGYERRQLSSLLGGLVTAGGMILVLARLYDIWQPADGRIAAPVAAAMALLLGMGLVAAAGTDAIPLRLLAGDSVRARLLRAHVAMLVSILLAYSLLYTAWPDQPSQIQWMRSLVLAGALVAVVGAGIWRFAGRMVGAVDDAEARQQQAEAALGASEREKEAILRDREEQRRVSFEDAAIGMAIVGLDGLIQQSNQALQQMLGYDAAELCSKRCVDLADPEDADRDFDLYEQLLAGQRRTYQIERRYLHKDGHAVWGRLSVSLVHGADGHPRFSIGVLEDITERKTAEEALRRSEEQLRQAQKMEAIGLLAGGIAHDFRNQLTVIKGYSEMLLRRNLVGEAARDHVQEILKAANRSATLTGELLAFGRKQILRPQAADLNDLVKEMVKPLRAMLGEDVCLSIAPAENLAKVWIDPGQFQQALVNLAANARDAMPAGGTLRIETANVTLDEAFAQRHAGASAGPHVMVAIQDSGAGMDEQTLARVFEPFFTTKPLGQGTGLGLSMVYGFLKQSGGHIDVWSRPGQGAEFRLYFRLSSEAVGSVSPSAANGVLPRGTGTILLVEDAAPIRALVARTLQECGYLVLPAADAQEALRQVSRHDGPIDLLITDVVMPGASGPELARQMRGMREGLRVLYITGYGGQALARRGLDGQAAEVLAKPFDSSMVIEAVRRVLGEAVAV